MKEIIISSYDGGYFWSISSANTIYNRNDYVDNKIHKTPILELCKFVDEEFWKATDSQIVAKVIQLFPNCEKIIICDDGDITIKNLRKGGKRNGNQ